MSNEFERFEDRESDYGQEANSAGVSGLEQEQAGRDQEMVRDLNGEI